MADPVVQHAALLEAVDHLQDTCGCGSPNPVLQAVVELHAPQDTYQSGTPTGGPLCFGCDMGPYAEDNADWPCSTVKVITSALGVDLNG
jgi:hypothetical protein